MSDSGAQETLSDVVARRVVLYRKRRDMTREQLAARCAELGYPELTGPALANIETGRRGKEGRRRRDVTVDELMVLAKALQVPAGLLAFPVGDEPTVPLFPDEAVTPWEALQWFAGEAYFGADVEQHWAVPIYLFRRHDRLRKEFLEFTFRDLPRIDDDEQSREMRRRQMGRLWSQLKDVRAEMRRHGLTPPPARDELEGIDDRPRLYMTADEAEDRVARGVEVRIVDQSKPDGVGKPMQPGDARKLREAIEEGRRFVADFEADQEDSSEGQR